MNRLDNVASLRRGLFFLGTSLALVALGILVHTWGANLSVEQFSLIVGLFSGGLSAILVAWDLPIARKQRTEVK
jgi:hypothetical protein